MCGAPLKATVYVWVHACIHVGTRLCTQMCVYMHMSLCVYTCVDGFMCVHTVVYAHLCLCTNIHGCVLRKGGTVCSCGTITPQKCAFLILNIKKIVRICFALRLILPPPPRHLSSISSWNRLDEKEEEEKEIEVPLKVNRSSSILPPS